MEVSPFPGIRYNQRIVRDLRRVLCPPYDVITPEEQRVCYRKSDYNAVRLESPAHSSQSTTDGYQRAAATFREWLKQGILQLDSTPSFYLHDHHFDYAGEKRVRRGLLARVKLEPWGNGIYAHEETSRKARSDRLQLMRACRANLSPLLCLYHGSEPEISRMLSHVAQGEPLVSLPEMKTSLRGSSEAHTVWAIPDSETRLQLTRALSRQRLYIADGHHRYETALAYREERMKEQSGSHESPGIVNEVNQSLPGQEAFNYVMMELVDFADPGLVILPLHRLVRDIQPSRLAQLRDRLEDLFVLNSISLEGGSYKLPADSCLGILGLEEALLVVLRQREGVSLQTMMPANRGQSYRQFNVSILNHIILNEMLGVNSKQDVAYTVDSKQAYRHIKEGKYQLAFVLNPPHPEMVTAVADARDRLPSKSTYFYPKVPVGLVINPLD